MSKKQREKVEDEVRYHREINNQQHQNGNSSSNSTSSTSSISQAASSASTQPDSSVFDPPQPSSTEHVYGG